MNHISKTLAQCSLLLTIILNPSSTIENSSMVIHPFTETFQQFKQKEDFKSQVLQSRKAMTKAIAKYKHKKQQRLLMKNATKKCQLLTFALGVSDTNAGNCVVVCRVISWYHQSNCQSKLRS